MAKTMKNEDGTVVVCGLQYSMRLVHSQYSMKEVSEKFIVHSQFCASCMRLVYCHKTNLCSNLTGYHECSIIINTTRNPDFKEVF